MFTRGENSMNDEYRDTMDKLKSIKYLIESTARNTNGDDVEYAKEALIFLSDNMSDALKNLEKIINTKEK